MDSLFPTVEAWWLSLRLIAIVNLCLLAFVISRIHKSRAYSAEIKTIRTKQYFFCTIYTVGCAFRSFVPASQIKRIGLVDSWITSSGMSRSVATVAELAFVIQWALLLFELARYTENKTILLLSRLIVPIITVAEVFSWYTCTTTNYIGTAVEESLWALAAGITMVGLFLARPYYQGTQKSFLTIGIPICLAYITYMLRVDIPNYVANWRAAEAADKVYLSVPQGLIDAFTTWHTTQAYEIWRYEMLWMTLYFSIAVWFSLVIVIAPRMDKGLLAANNNAS